MLCAVCPAARAEEPALISAGGGIYNFDKHPDNRVSRDYRLEYRFATSLLPAISSSFDAVEPYLQVRPAVGIEGNSRGALYFNGGLNIDIPFLRYGILTWGESIGAFGKGNETTSLGCMLQFRSQAELGVRFPNGLRITGFISHISNAHLVRDNPGAEIVGAYLHLPFSLFGGP